MSLTKAHLRMINGPSVNLIDFGADPTGTIDSTLEITSAIAAAKASGKRVVGSGTFLISEKVVINCAFDGSDMIWNVSGSPSVAVEVSTGSSENPTDILSLTTEQGIILPSLVNLDKPVTGWAGQGIGVRYVNVQNMKITERLVENFATGVVHTSYTTGCGYNTIQGGYLRNNGVNRFVTIGDASGAFTNRWDIYGGRYFHSSAEGTETPGVIHIDIDAPSAGNIINDFNFFGASLEGVAEQYHVRCGGNFINFIGCRWESSSPGGVKLHLASGGISGQGSCSIVMGRGGSKPDINITRDAGAAGRVAIHSSYSGGLISSPEPSYVLKNSNSSADPILVGYEASTDQFTSDVSTDYSTFIGSQRIGGKRAADSHDRVYLDLQNSRIYFGDGSSSATKLLQNLSSYIASNAGLVPTADGTLPLGQSSLKWSELFAASGTINTSDERQKQDIRNLSAAEQAVAVRLKSLVKAYRFKSAYEKKGDDARIHVGVIAQEVIEAFEAEGLDPMRYGVVCYDQWDDVIDEDGNVILPAGDSYGVRYDELWAFIISAL